MSVENRTYIQDKNGNKYFFDINTDTSKNSSSEVADSPIDARKGATLQDKRIVNMKTIGLTGKFSARASNNSCFNTPENRLGIIISYFEESLKKQEIYTVCRKGSLYDNMMLNKVTFKFDEYCTTVEVSLSFIEVNIITIETKDTYKFITDRGAMYDKMQAIADLYDLQVDSSEEQLYFKLSNPILDGEYGLQKGGKYGYETVIIVQIKDPGDIQSKYNHLYSNLNVNAVGVLNYKEDGEPQSESFREPLDKYGSTAVIIDVPGRNKVTDVEIIVHFEGVITNTEFFGTIKDSDIVRYLPKHTGIDYDSVNNY